MNIRLYACLNIDERLYSYNGIKLIRNKYLTHPTALISGDLPSLREERGQGES